MPWFPLQHHRQRNFPAAGPRKLLHVQLELRGLSTPPLLVSCLISWRGKDGLDRTRKQEGEGRLIYPVALLFLLPCDLEKQGDDVSFEVQSTPHPSPRSLLPASVQLLFCKTLLMAGVPEPSLRGAAFPDQICSAPTTRGCWEQAERAVVAWRNEQPFPQAPCSPQVIVIELF